MLTSEFWGKVHQGLTSLGELGGAEAAALAERLAAALEPVAQAAFLESVDALVQEYNLRHGKALAVTISADDVQISPLADGSDAVAPPLGDLTARFALRLSDDLKSRFEEAASASGMSANAWILRTIDKSLRSDGTTTSTPGRHQMRGRGRS